MKKKALKTNNDMTSQVSYGELGQFWTSTLRILVSRAQVLLVNPCGVFRALTCGTVLKLARFQPVLGGMAVTSEVHEVPSDSLFSI